MDNHNYCPSCNYIANFEVILCQSCRKSFHRICANLNESAYAGIIAANGELQWYCMECKSSNSLSKADKLDFLVNKLDSFQNDMNKYVQELNQIKTTIENQEPNLATSEIIEPVVNTRNSQNCICSGCGIPILSTSKTKKTRCAICISNNIFSICTETNEALTNDSNLEIFEPPSNYIEKVPEGYYPVKKRTLSVEKKCNRCHGAGVIYVKENEIKQSSTNSLTYNSVKIVNINTNDSKKVQPKNQFQCNICLKMFINYSSLWQHDKKLHKDVKENQYKCEICKAMFDTEICLKKHFKTHGGEKPYKCKACNKQFLQLNTLRNHEKIHSGEKPFICVVCNQGFARRATLRNHRLLHTGEKPYKCNICGTSFRQSQNLHNHIKVHTGAKPHKCDICPRSFSSISSLKIHKNVHKKYGKLSFPVELKSNGECDNDQLEHRMEKFEEDDETYAVILKDIDSLLDNAFIQDDN